MTDDAADGPKLGTDKPLKESIRRQAGIESVGALRIIASHSLDLAATMKPSVIKAVQQRRASMTPVVPRITDLGQRLWPAGIGPYTEVAQDGHEAARRNELGYAHFNKTVLSQGFISQIAPETYMQPAGSPLSVGTQHVRVGETFQIQALIGESSNPAVQIAFRRSAFTLYDDAVAVIWFEFEAQGIAVADLVELAAGLQKVTQRAAGEKLSATLSAGATNITPLASRRDDFIEESLKDASAALRNYGCSHLTLITDALHKVDGDTATHDEAVKDPALTAILRRSPAAKEYRARELANTGKGALGYKTDELYLTVRGTSLLVVPGYWNPQSFLSLYVDDLMALLTFTVSRVSLVDFTTHQTGSMQAVDLESGAPAEELVADLLLLKRLLLTIEEHLRLDLWVNHYFTRVVVSQLQEQRGLPNKLGALQSRIESLEGILNVAAQSRLTGRSIEAAIIQVRVALVALIITAVLTAASIGLTAWTALT